MSIKIEKNNLKKAPKLKTFSLIILLYLTKNLRTETELLIPFLQSHGLRLEKFKEKTNWNTMTKGPIFSKNANYIIRSHQFLSFEDCALLSQLLLSKVTVLSFFYNGRMLNASRLKLFQQNLDASGKESRSPFYNVWKFFDHQNF